MGQDTQQGENAPSLAEAALLERLGLSLDGGQWQALHAYGALVRRWNRVAKLVAKDDLRRFFNRHVVDSLVLAPLIHELEGASGQPSAQDAAASPPIADFGSGAGLPGVPLAVALPELAFTLIDRSEKKARFLRRVRDELTLPNVRVLCADVKELPAGSCRGVVARAAMPLPALWRRARAVLRPGGYLLVLDRTTRARGAPTDELPGGCEGGKIRRRWIEMPQLGAWHGILEVREIAS